MDPTKAMSLDKQSQMIRDAWYQATEPIQAKPMMADGPSGGWVVEVYQDHIITSIGQEYFKVPYTMGEDGCTFAARVDWQQVEEKREWVEVVKALELKYGNRNNSEDRARVRKLRGMLNDAVNVTRELEPDDEDKPMLDPDKAVIVYGEPVKATRTDAGVKVGGYLIRFTTAKDPDLTGEFFDGSTDYDIDEFPAKATVYFHHGLDAKVGKRKLSRAELRKDEAGIWAETILQERDEYEKFIAQLALDGKLGWSSGTAKHLSDREPAGKAVHITRWPIVEASLTHTPAEPRNSVLPLKSLITAEATQDGTPEAAGNAAAEPTNERQPAELKTVDLSVEGESEMTDKLSETPEFKALEARMDEQAKNIDRLVKLIEDSPAVRKSGYYSVDGGKADQNVKSFGDFLLSVKRGDVTRLQSVYGSIKDLAEDSGASGGYLVPTDYRNDLIKVAFEASPILNLVSVFPVTGAAGEWPALDQYAAPTAGSGNTAMAGGVVATKRAEGGAYTATEPSFEDIKWRVASHGGYTKVTNELIADSGTAIEALLVQLFGVAVSAKREYHILRGNGVSEPLGILNASNVAIGIAPDTNNYFAWADALEMESRLKAFNPTRVRWITHRSLIPDFGTWEVGTAGAGTRSLSDTGHGDPIYSEHLPQANNSGCALLADLSAYALFVRQGLTIAFSEHADFLNGKGTWRFDERYDGQPWLKKSITLADPQGSFTVSPFVYLND